MRSLYLVLLATAVFLAVSGFQCVECEESYCAEPLAVRFLSKADGSNLFANGTYNIDNLHAFSMWADSTMAVQQFYVWSSDQNPGEKLIHFDLFEIAGPIVAYVFQFDNQEQDTLQVRYFKQEAECCGEVPNFMFGIYRGDTVYAGQGGIIDLKK